MEPMKTVFLSQVFVADPPSLTKQRHTTSVSTGKQRRRMISYQLQRDGVITYPVNLLPRAAPAQTAHRVVLWVEKCVQHLLSLVVAFGGVIADHPESLVFLTAVHVRPRPCTSMLSVVCTSGHDPNCVAGLVTSPVIVGYGEIVR